MLAECLMVPEFLFQKIAGVESAPNEVISMMEGVLFRSHKKADAKRCASSPPRSPGKQQLRFAMVPRSGTPKTYCLLTP